MDYKHTRDIIFTGFGRPFFAPSLFYPSTTHPQYFYLSIFVFTHPNDGWTGLYIKLWRHNSLNRFKTSRKGADLQEVTDLFRDLNDVYLFLKTNGPVKQQTSNSLSLLYRFRLLYNGFCIENIQFCFKVMSSFFIKPV